MAERSGEVGGEAGCDDGEPVRKKRQLLHEEFAAVASCDASAAGRYLAENNWEMEVRALLLRYSFPSSCARTRPISVSLFQRALNAYFERPVEEGALKRHPESEPGS